ncbi:hypothetical protein K491DRAFT_223410 [Lophiostoma macrostomum CBS 122681]|uniref:Uncharacterized protein n=1 Tax=Lophiostoma macrostomum CBS 122681 TaxID=1314788 RepID=A0A6A6TG66_9PLEO|nr:hypothetical protein K491DRAFT_223410 [Lophiostoma macrostomum CBS 122681]
MPQRNIRFQVTDGGQAARNGVECGRPTFLLGTKFPDRDSAPAASPPTGALTPQGPSASLTNQRPTQARAEEHLEHAARTPHDQWRCRLTNRKPLPRPACAAFSRPSSRVFTTSSSHADTPNVAWFSTRASQTRAVVVITAVTTAIKLSEAIFVLDSVPCFNCL